MIVGGGLQPAEQLVQESLAERLNLGRKPLREAIATLAQEGFVEMTSRGAAFVRSFSDEDLISIWEIRAVLEGLVSRTAARNSRNTSRLPAVANHVGVRRDHTTELAGIPAGRSGVPQLYRGARTRSAPGAT
jgi:DNA-binding GntR family transcriptional regulator